jgi:PleD family two-component response regulator
MRTHLAALEIPHPASLAGPWVTMSIGIATVVPTSSFSAALLLETADRALYRAKEEGRDRVIGVEA